MAIVNTVARVLPGFGSPASYTAKTAALTGTATTTQALSSPVTNGYVRLKWSGPNAATTAIFSITLTDGTTTYSINGGTTITAAGTLLDMTIPFNIEINANSISVVATLGGATTTGTLDIEVAGNP